MALLSVTSLIVIVKLVTGAFQYLANYMLTHAKVQLEGEPEPKKFKKNVFTTAFIFLSMFLVVLPFFVKECRDFNASRLLSGLKPAHPYNKRAYLLTLLPSVLDVFAVELSMFATKFIGPSTMILLKSLRIIVSAVLTRTILGKSQKRYQWAAVFVTLVGLVPVALSNALRPEIEPHDKKDTTGAYWPYLAVLIGEILRGFRYVYEEKLIKAEKLSAEFVVYIESLIGLVISSLLIPVMHYLVWVSKTVEVNGGTQTTVIGPYEDMFETFKMISISREVQVLLAINFFLIGIHNYTTTLITKHLTSMHNMIISQGRAIVSWLPGVLIYNYLGIYCGERLDSWTTVDFLGYVFLVLGALLYNGNVKFPCISLYPIEDEDELKVKSPTTTVSPVYVMEPSTETA